MTCLLCSSPAPKLRNKAELGFALDHALHRPEHLLPRLWVRYDGTFQCNLLGVASPVEVHAPGLVPVLLVEEVDVQQGLCNGPQILEL